MDLNTLIPADSPLYLTSGASINDWGQIVGNAIVKSSCPPANPPNWEVNQSACTEIHANPDVPIARLASEDVFAGLTALMMAAFIRKSTRCFQTAPPHGTIICV